MKSPNLHQNDASTLAVTIAVVATILVLLGSAVAYTQHVSRMSDRTRKVAQAMEVGDGHLEFLFTHWRNISRAPGLRYTVGQPMTNFFSTTDYPNAAPVPWTNPAPYPNPWPGTPPTIPRPATTLFPDVPQYEVAQYRIQAVTPMIELDEATGNSTLAVNQFPPAAYGPNTYQYSFFYLASVDVSIPALNGNVTAKVRRVFEKKYDNPWTFALFYNDDLELHPSDPLTIDGPIHTNGNLYIGTNKLTVQDSTISTRPPSKVSYAGEYLNGFSPSDTSTRTGGVTKPTFPPKLPPAQDSPYLPFGWNLKLTNADGSVNNDSYHELVEQFNPCGTAESDPLLEVRYYNQAGMKAVIVNTQLAQGSAAGATVITVANVTGLAVNMTLQIGTTPERRVIATGGINCTTKQVTLTSALTNPHSAGETVQTGELTTLTANVAAGANEIYVASNNNFVVGDTIRVGTTSPEVKVISNLSSSDRIRFTTNLASAHTVGERVQAGDITVANAAGTRLTYSGSSGNDRNIYNLVLSAVYPRRSLYDYQQLGTVQIADVDINKITVAVDAGTVTNFLGVFYVSDTGAVANIDPAIAIRRGIRLINGYRLPVLDNNTKVSGLTVVSENPVYIKGNYNTGETSANPPSNTDPTASSVVGTYTRRPAAVIADAITVLSSAWSDSYNSSNNITSRAAASTTINSALVSGTVPSGTTFSDGTKAAYSGGGENFIRLMEDWNSNDRVFCYWGSMVQLYQSKQAVVPFNGAGNMFKSPKISRYYWDSGFGKKATDTKPYLGSPPGNLIIAAYLQQQRWYQVY
jgi:hypothetical protein